MLLVTWNLLVSWHFITLWVPCCWGPCLLLHPAQPSARAVTVLNYCFGLVGVNFKGQVTICHLQLLHETVVLRSTCVVDKASKKCGPGSHRTQGTPLLHLLVGSSMEGIRKASRTEKVPCIHWLHSPCESGESVVLVFCLLQQGTQI